MARVFALLPGGRFHLIVQILSILQRPATFPNKRQIDLERFEIRQQNIPLDISTRTYVA